MPLVTPVWCKLCFVSHVYSCFRLCMYWEILLQGRQLNGFITLSWQSTEVFIIQGRAAQSLVMAVHVNYLYVTASSTACWITWLLLSVFSCGSSMQILPLIHSLLQWPWITSVLTEVKQMYNFHIHTFWNSVWIYYVSWSNWSH